MWYCKIFKQLFHKITLFIPDSFYHLLFQKLFQHNVCMPRYKLVKYQYPLCIWKLATGFSPALISVWLMKVIVIVIFNQEVHSVKLIFSGALDKHTIYTTNIQKKTSMHTKHTTKETKTKLQLRIYNIISKWKQSDSPSNRGL